MLPQLPVYTNMWSSNIGTIVVILELAFHFIPNEGSSGRRSSIDIYAIKIRAYGPT